MKSRLIALCCAIVLLTLASVAALAASPSPDELAYAYLYSTTGYMIVGRRVEIRVILPEQSPPYQYEFTLYYTHNRAETRSYQGIDRVKAQSSSQYSFVPDKPGQYILDAVITDSKGRSLTLESEPFYCYEEQAEQDPSTLPGKVRAIVAKSQVARSSGNYDRAVYLHDWLIHNADYDASKRSYSPEGVLLMRKGVCDSYALAYHILLREAGIECLYVTGQADGNSHAWNLANLEGEWTHIDPTWDDPVGGGKEGHEYFGLTSELMSLDHDWSKHKQRIPAATATGLNYLFRNGWLAFDSARGLTALLKMEMGKGNQSIRFRYVGRGTADWGNVIEAWVRDNGRYYFLDGYSMEYDKLTATMTNRYGDYSDFAKFTDNASFEAGLLPRLRARAPEIKLYYMGSNPDFEFGTYMTDWLKQHAKAYSVASYQLSYSSYYGICKLTYR